MATLQEAPDPTTAPHRSRAVAVATAVLLAVLGLLVVAAATGHSGSDPVPALSAEPLAPVSCDNHIDSGSVFEDISPAVRLATALDSISVCYEPGSMESGAITSPVVVADPAAMTELVAALGAGDKWPDGPIACPADFGEQFDLVLTHREGTRQTVVVTTSGCRSVFAAGTFHQATQPLIDQLDTLFPDPNRP